MEDIKEKTADEMKEILNVLEGILKGDRDCLETELKYNPTNTEDIEHWKKEIWAIETIISLYNKEKARADKLVKDYSELLTKLDELRLVRR